jgi:hypothetical protein
LAYQALPIRIRIQQDTVTDKECSFEEGVDNYMMRFRKGFQIAHSSVDTDTDTVDVEAEKEKRKKGRN